MDTSKYYIKIFGCQMNYSDAERISAVLEKHRMKEAASIHEADLVVFVTCGVRQSAEDRVYGQINNLREKFPEKIIILTGCLAHRKDVQRRLLSKIDLFFSIKDTSKLNDFTSQKFPVSSFQFPKKSQNQNYKLPITNYLKLNARYKSKYTACVPIMTGCNNYCSYCVVPYARGREYSRPAEDILKEVKSLVKKGYKEIVLLGQNVNSYNPELQTSNFKLKNKSKLPTANYKLRQINFADLLKLIDAIPGNFWITFLTSHPKDMSDDLIESIAKSKKICEYVSLPAQSGDDQILHRMNRKYKIEHYKDLVKKIRKAYLENRPSLGNRVSKLPPSISTDIIVGFPGETKRQFENTAKLFREIKFDMAYISQYSPRPETLAWKMEDNVSKKEKIRREKILTKILEKNAFENNKKYIRKVVEVLVDKINPKNKSSDFPKLNLGKSYIGHTRTQKKVLFHSNKKITAGSFAKVKISNAKAFGLEGKTIKNT